MKQKLLIVFLFFSIYCIGQENCNNGIDDDGDGMIDLNDSDCVCNNAVKTSLIQNHSFEEKIRCSQWFTASPPTQHWTKGTIPSPSYINTDCGIFNKLYDKKLNNFPDGKGIIKAVYHNNKKEYIATKLTAPLLTGVNYQLTLDIASLMGIERTNLSKNFDFNFLAPTYVTLYGCNNKDNLPLNTTSDPNSFDSSWIEIGKVLYQPQTAWGEITINFTTGKDINAIMLGPEKILPPSFNTDYEPSFFYDNLRLNTAENFVVTINESGHFCNNDLVLTANLNKTLNLATTFQWYRNGIAINGATNKSYPILSVKENLGEYIVKVTYGNECFISSKLTVNNSIPNPSVTIVQPTCQNPNVSITVNEPGMEYSFFKGLDFLADDYHVTKELVWQAEANFTTTVYGKYYVQARTASGCISTPTIVTLNPPILLDQPTFSIIQPLCNSGGTITINTPGSQFSFDNGLSWQNSSTKKDMPPGNYLVKIKNSSGCQSYSQNVLLSPYYINSPAYTVTQPSCSQAGKITITTSASEYSFDNGETWTENPTADNLPSGYYNVRIRNEYGCESKPYYNQIYLNEFSKLNLDFHITQPNSCCDTGSIMFLNSAHKYSVDNGQSWSNSPIFNDLQSGIYQLIAQNELDCESQVSQVMINFFIPAPTLTTINPTCTSKNGSITITSPASEYSFDNGETWTTNPTTTNLPPGYYNTRIKNELGCVSDVAYAYLPAFYFNAPAYEIINPDCETESKWSIAIKTPAASYSFDGGQTWSTNSYLSNLDYGIYYLKTRNSLGCESNNAIAIIYNEYYLAPPEYSIVQATCSTPASVTITTPAALYSFNDGATWSTNPNLTEYPNGGVSGFIRIKNKTGCISNHIGFNLLHNSIDIPGYTIVQPTTCDSNATGSITITTLAEYYSFDGGLSWRTDPTASNLPVGFTYQLAIKNKEGCVSGNNIVEFTTSTKDVEYIVTHPSYGIGGTITIITPAAFYSFDGGETWGKNAIAKNLPPGHYYPKIKNESGCIFRSLYSIHFEDHNYSPSLNIQVVDPTCESKNNGSITVNGTYNQYSFDGGFTWSQHNTATNLSSGSYSIKVKDNLGNESMSKTAILKHFYLPAPDYTSIVPDCEERGTITIITPAAAYSFDNGKTWDSKPTKSNLPEGFYNLMIKNALGCESHPQPLYLMNVNRPAQTPIISVQQPSSCTSTKGIISVITTATLYSFDDGITWSSNSTATDLSEGHYFIRTKNSPLGCSSAPVKVIIDPPLDPISKPNHTVSQPTSCINPFGAINITTVAHAYSFDDGLSWKTNASESFLSPGSYKIRIKNSVGCESEAVGVQINTPTDYPDSPTYSIIQPDCNNSKGKITINTPAATYSFDNGKSWNDSQISTFLHQGKYLLIVKNSNGCISDAVEATVIPFISSLNRPTAPDQQTFCIQQNATINNIEVTGQNIKWYNVVTNGTILPNMTLLENGKTYYATQTINGCESERIPVTVNVQNTPSPAGNVNQSFCTGQNPTIVNIQINGDQIKWYDALHGGSVLNETTNLVDGKTYYASQTINGCESERLEVRISIVNIPSAPAGSATQEFCKRDNEVLSDLQISGQNIKWYDTSTSRTALAYSTLLENNKIYYASQTIGCESDRIPILVKIQDTTLPKGNNNQQFCIEEIATLENLNISGTNIKWYDSATNGTILSPTTLLQNDVYYVTQTSNNCESERLAVNVKIQDTQIPIVDSPQIFCIQKNALVKDIKIAGQNTMWFENLSTTTFLSENTPLENGVTYYASQSINNCESERIPVTINILGATTGECINFVEELPFPKFFTPNNDGHNDTWTIDFAYLSPNSGILIYDRYGKLIRELRVNEAWDGTYNGTNLPSSDYWFSVTRLNGKEVRSHFSLKR